MPDQEQSAIYPYPYPAGASAASASTPQLDESHILPLAVAAQGAHYPNLINQIETAAPQYINDAKSFLAMFNAALGILSQLFPAGRAMPVPPPNPASEATRQQQA